MRDFQQIPIKCVPGKRTEIWNTNVTFIDLLHKIESFFFFFFLTNSNMAEISTLYNTPYD